jgi:hypothetical protein
MSDSLSNVAATVIDRVDSSNPASSNADVSVGELGKDRDQLTLRQFSSSVKARIERCIKEINRLKGDKEPVLHFEVGALISNKRKLMVHVYHIERLTLERWVQIKSACQTLGIRDPCVRFDGGNLHHCDTCKIGSVQLQVDVEPAELISTECAKLPSPLHNGHDVKNRKRWFSKLGFLNPLRFFQRSGLDVSSPSIKKRKPITDDSYIDLESERLNLTDGGEIRIPEDVVTEFFKKIIDEDDRIRGFEVIKSLYSRAKISRTTFNTSVHYFTIISEIPATETIPLLWIMSIYSAHTAFLTQKDIYIDMEQRLLVVRVNNTRTPRAAVVVPTDTWNNENPTKQKRARVTTESE